MAQKRIELQYLLETILESKNVYFQPPSSIQMKYPAIVYSLNDINSVNANNNAYLLNHSYEIIVIDRNPDSKIPDKLSQLPYCNFSRFYTADNLNHYAFNITY